MGCCYIVGAAPANDVHIEIKKDDYVIAADGGYDILCNIGITPDLIVGDFDSTDLKERIANLDVKTIQFPSEKDDTDMALAVRYGRERGYKRFVIYGALGGRIDHTLANIQLLASLLKEGLEVELIGDAEIITGVSNGTISFSEEKKGVVSVFSHSDVSLGVTIEGLKYEVHDISLANTFALGVSNEFVGKKSVVKVTDGTLIIVYNR